MVHRLLCNALTVFGFLLLGVAAWQLALSLDQPGASLDLSELNVKAIEAGSVTTAAVVLRNESWHPVRVVGLGTC